MRVSYSATAACIVLGLVRVPISAYVCGSASPAPTMCQIAASYDAIFLGKAITTRETFEETGPGFGYSVMHVRLKVLEAFRGVDHKTRSIELEYRLAPESAQFTQGVTYIVYAHRAKDGRLSVSGCSPTRPIAQAQDEIRYFRSAGGADSNAPCPN